MHSENDAARRGQHFLFVIKTTFSIGNDPYQSENCFSRKVEKRITFLKKKPNFFFQNFQKLKKQKIISIIFILFFIYEKT